MNDIRTNPADPAGPASPADSTVRAPRAGQNLADVIDRLTVPADLVRTLPTGKLECTACGHRCKIGEGKRGICQVRFNKGGTLLVPSGYVAGLQCDPIEKKPFFHIAPGRDALTFGMLGCDFHCGYCQNWLTSQALRDESSGVRPQRVTAPEIVQMAHNAGARMIVSSYNEPLITTEWSVSVFREAHATAGDEFLCGFVSNGNATEEALDYLRPHAAAYKIDLKSFNDKSYRQLGGTLQNVTDSIRNVHARGFWLEVVTLLIPGFNSGDDEVKQMADFLVGVSPDIPWHLTAYHQDYKMTTNDRTQADDLLRAIEIGRAAGMRFVYAGNLPGRVGDNENTRCPSCSKTLVERHGFRANANGMRVEADGTGYCSNADCNERIPGIWA